jgi:hypothetical protein
MHPELEMYARNVALEIEKQVRIEGLDYIIVKKSPVKRNFAKLLEEYDASWILDLHSDVTEPYWVKKNDKWVRALPYAKLGRRTLWDRQRPPSDYYDIIGKPTPIARIVYGGSVRDPHATLELGHLKPRNWVGKTLVKFALETYGDVPFTLMSFYPMRRHERLIAFGLLYIRPLNTSVELVKSLAEYLYERF